MNQAMADIPVVFFTLEMSAEQLTQRMLSNLATMDGAHFLNPTERISTQDFMDLGQKADLLKSKPLYIVDLHQANLDRIEGETLRTPSNGIVADRNVIVGDIASASVIAGIAAGERDGRDIYVREAAGIYRVPEDQITKDQRQIGKVAVLSLGFAGGIGAFSVDRVKPRRRHRRGGACQG